MRELTKGKPLKVILAFYFPVLLGGLFHQFYIIADTAIVGQFIGTKALAAMGAAGPLMFLMLGFVLGMTGGFCIPIARAFGAGDMPAMRRYLAGTIQLSIAATAIISLLTVTLAGPILRAMNTPDDIFDLAYRYIIVIFAGIGAFMLYNTLASIARAVGDSRTPLYFLIVSSVLNIGLDLLFILVFDLGMLGIGLASVVAQFCAGSACFIYMRRKFPELTVRKGEWKPDWPRLRELLGVGIPMAIQFSIIGIGFVALQTFVNPHGWVVVAAVSASSRVFNSLFIPPLEALGLTMATFASQNLGAKKLDRVRTGVRLSLMLSTVFSFAGLAIAVTVGPYIGLLFVSEGQTEIMPKMLQFFWGNGLFLWGLGALFVLRSTIQGLGYAAPTVAVGLLELVARGAVGFFFVRPYGFTAICFANPAAWLTAVAMLVPMYFVVMRRTRRKLAEGQLAIDN